MVDKVRRCRDCGKQGPGYDWTGPRCRLCQQSRYRKYYSAAKERRKLLIANAKSRGDVLTATCSECAASVDFEELHGGRCKKCDLKKQREWQTKKRLLRRRKDEAISRGDEPFVSVTCSDCDCATQIEDAKYHPRCQGCHSKKNSVFQKRQMKKRREIWLALLVGKSCVNCGQTDGRLLEYAHRDRATKTNNVSVLLFHGRMEAALEEITKCKLLCGNRSEEVV